MITKEELKSEGWEVTKEGSNYFIIANGQKFPINTPALSIHKKFYRESDNPAIRYYHFKRMHDLLWPAHLKTWHYWTERRFQTHCEDWKFISYAGLASSAKSFDEAKIGIIEYISNKAENRIIVASTTLESLKGRIWGYITSLLEEVKHIDLGLTYIKSPTPKILRKGSNEELHGMFAMAAAVGSDAGAIRNYIGRHPKGRLILILDEAPDLDPVVLESIANLQAGEARKFQLTAIGNSHDRSDLHGGLSTPEAGWDSIDRLKDVKWKTVHDKGVCLYFSPFESPAIHEKDPEKKKLLSKFLITEDQIVAQEKQFGKDSIQYWRMVLGFWQDQGTTQDVHTTKQFLEQAHVDRKSLWSGLHPLHMVGGLDAAFSTGGDKCILRLGVIGHDSTGQIVLDFREKALLFSIPMLAKHPDPIEIQIADHVIAILLKHNTALQDIAMDCTGQGRVLGELIRIRAKETKGINWQAPLKIYHSRNSQNKSKQSTDIVVKSPTELWDAVREFVNTKQLAGLDPSAVYQFSTRRVIFNTKTKRRELESKLEYKNRMAGITPGKNGSPDEADALALTVYAACMRYGFHKEQTKAIEVTDFHSQKMDAQKKQDAQMTPKRALMGAVANYANPSGSASPNPLAPLARYGGKK